MPILSPNTKMDNFKVAAGVHTTVAASDSVATGLKEVLHVVACLETDPADNTMLVSAVPGSNGNVTIKTWRNTAGTDPTPIAADAFSKKVQWIAFGY